MLNTEYDQITKDNVFKFDNLNNRFKAEIKEKIEEAKRINLPHDKLAKVVEALIRVYKKEEKNIQERNSVSHILKKARSNSKSENRLKEDRKKFLYGALVMSDPNLQAYLADRLHAFLTREDDRKVFDFKVTTVGTEIPTQDLDGVLSKNVVGMSVEQEEVK